MIFNIENTISSMLCKFDAIFVPKNSAEAPGVQGSSLGFSLSDGPWLPTTIGKVRRRRGGITRVKNRVICCKPAGSAILKCRAPLEQADKICNRLEDYLDDLLDASFDGMVISDAEGNVLKANRAYQRLSTIAPEEIVGQNLGDMVRNKVLKGAVVFEVTKTRVPTTKIHTYERTGKVAMVTGSPVFDDQGTLIYVVANFRDVTQLRNLSKNSGPLLRPLQLFRKRELLPKAGPSGVAGLRYSCPQQENEGLSAPGLAGGPF